MTITRRRVPGKRMAAAAALSACLCVPAVAHAEADGNAHAWLVSGTPLTQTLNVWVHQEQSDAPSPLTVTAQIAVAGRTIASTAPVTTPAVTEFQTVAIDLTVPATVLAQARSAARAARVGNAVVTLTASSAGNPTGDADWFAPRTSRTTVWMPLIPGAAVRRQRLSRLSFAPPAGWRRVGLSRFGLATFAPVPVRGGCTMVVLASAHTVTRAPNLRSWLGNASVTRSGALAGGGRYVLGTMKGGVPRLFNGMAAGPPPIVRAVASVRIGRRFVVAGMEGRPDAGCKASAAGTAAALKQLERAVRTARAVS